MLAMSEWDSRVIGSSDYGRNPWYDLEGNPGISQFFSFLAAASEDIRIASFQADNGSSLSRFLKKQLVEFALGNCMVSGTLTSINYFSALWGEAKEVAIDERVVNDHVRPS